MNKKICQHFWVSGRVQSVYYRQSTLQKAKQLAITGWVKNLADGRVEVVACGEEEKLRTFHAWLEKGPPLAKVTSVSVKVISTTEFTEFVIA